MNFRWPLLLLLLVLNTVAILALWRSVAVWVKDESRQRWAKRGIACIALLLNLPLLAFFIRPLDLALLRVSATVLEIVFYPATAWLATIVAFFLVVALPGALWKLGRLLVRRQKPSPQPSPSVPVAFTRREMLAGSAGLLLPAIYGVAAYGTYGSLNDLDISEELSIPVTDLPRSLEGLTIVQVSDLHVGPYIREQELRRLVGVVNSLRPDLVVITGDVLDRSLDSLPDAVRGLTGISASLGTFAVLGNHDIYADRYSYDRDHRGGVKIVDGLQASGIRTLRNEVVHVGNGPDQIALMGLDWLNASDRGTNFFQYNEPRTQRALRSMVAQVDPGAPKLLLAHHPDTFSDARAAGIDLTLSGHTHGGGQILLGHLNGVPLGVAMLRFKYLSGLYQEQGCTLYVNRGIGYLGVPIRINCPPEISRFRLIRPVSGLSLTARPPVKPNFA